MARNNILSLGKRDALDIFNHAIEAAKPESIIEKAIRFTGEKLIVVNQPGSKEIEFDLRNTNVHVVGGGKSVLGMAMGLADVAKQAEKSHLFSHGSISVPLGLKPRYYQNRRARGLLRSIGVDCWFGSDRNLPDSESVSASNAILEQISFACDHDRLSKREPLFIVLLSGGGSACLTSPKYISLEQKLQLIHSLVQKGADIVELNTVRRYFSSIKGGRLATHIVNRGSSSRILSLILSDVIGDPIEFIASGPTFVENLGNGNSPTQHDAMLGVLTKYSLENGALLNIMGEPDINHRVDFANEQVTNCVIGNNKLALEAAASRAEALDYRVNLLADSIKGSSESAVEKIIKLNQRETSGCTAIICGGEVTINKQEGENWGKGGRAQEMALDYIISRSGSGLDINPDQEADMFLAGGTDGQDGPTDMAGCLASYVEWCSKKRKTTLEEALEAKGSHDSYKFWKLHKPDWLIETGLTGTNVMDIYLLLTLRGKYE